MNPTSPTTGPSRRQLITTGAFGAAAAAFLAACGTKTDRTAGQSGVDPTTTAVAPTVPIAEITAADKAEDIDQLRTATSLELLAAQLYTQYGKVLTDADWKANAARYAEDHAAAAEVFKKETPAKDRVDEPNEWLQTNTVDPIADQLTNDRAILDFFAGLESTLAATYIAAVGTMTQAENRAQFAGYAEAAARRTAVMDNSGKGAPPESALYPLQDLIPNEAYVTVTQATAN